MGDGKSFWIEKITSEEDSISLAWHDFLEPFMLTVEAGSNPNRPHGFIAALYPLNRPK
ncbi:MAG: hypothetical protein CM1200mP35_03940 [Chloroflexota bacterium]|nr:MAG: hypothetical protein CM1200mP35_03940 [Chloroflexota bacterium]